MTPAERIQLEYLANQLLAVARGPDLSEYNVEVLALEVRALAHVPPTESFITAEDRRLLDTYKSWRK